MLLSLSQSVRFQKLTEFRLIFAVSAKSYVYSNNTSAPKIGAKCWNDGQNIREAASLREDIKKRRHLKYSFPMSPSVGSSVDHLVGRSRLVGLTYKRKVRSYTSKLLS